MAMETILVIDSRANRKYLKDLLTAVGYQVIFRSMQATLRPDFTYQDEPTAVVVAWNQGKALPQAACSAIRRASFNVPLIVLGPRNHVAAKVKLLDLGVDDYIEEPFDSLELIARLHAAIRRSRVRALGAHH